MASEKTVTNLNNGFTELWTSVLTPLNPDLSIDITKYISHVKALLENGSKGVCIFDATGEGASFSCSERQAVLDELIKEKIPSKSLLVCTTAASIEDTRTLTLNAVSQNVYGCLMGAPFFYNKSSNQGIINSYAYIFNRDFPIEI